MKSKKPSKRMGRRSPYVGIKSHLKPYIILTRRRGTINHAFASAIAPYDKYDEHKVREAIQTLGQDPDCKLQCVYCGNLAETWDHVFATVRGTVFSGHGHRLGNLVPCCKPCNSKKSNKDWHVHITSLNLSSEHLQCRSKIIRHYLQKYAIIDATPLQSQQYLELQDIRQQVLKLLAKADQIAADVRNASPEDNGAGQQT